MTLELFQTNTDLLLSPVCFACQSRCRWETGLYRVGTAYLSEHVHQSVEKIFLSWVKLGRDATIVRLHFSVKTKKLHTYMKGLSHV